MVDLSIVIPVFCSERTLGDLIDHVIQETQKWNIEIILVNDFSIDSSWHEIEKIYQKYSPKIKAIDLAKNYGEHNAVWVGYSVATGKYIVTMDDDGQNPPTEIPHLLAEIQNKYDVVFSCYTKKRHSFFRNLGSRCSGLSARIVHNSPPDIYLSSFKIITRELKENLLQHWKKDAYIDILIIKLTSKIGKKSVMHFNAPVFLPSRYNLPKLIKLWLHMIFTRPKRNRRGNGPMLEFSIRQTLGDVCQE